MSISVKTLEIPDVMIIEPTVFTDDRGDFFEGWNEVDFATATGFNGRFVQDNQSRSRAGVLRGLHYQLPHPQGKLVRILAGLAFTVAVDLRRSSPSFGESVDCELSADNRLQLWVPPGFAHGFLALADPTDVLYKVTSAFAPDCEREIRWNDPELGIQWPIGDEPPSMSDRDRAALRFADAPVYR